MSNPSVLTGGRLGFEIFTSSFGVGGSAGCTTVSPVYKQDIDTAYLLHNKERGQRELSQLQYDKELEVFAQHWARR